MKRQLSLFVVALLANALPLQVSATSVSLNLYGQVILPNSFPDDTFAYADLTLYDGVVQLADLHIVSEDYYDPIYCYYYGLNCDTCGVASGNGYASVDIECGKTYDFLLEGNACLVTGLFGQLPAGYMLEWQTPPSGPVVDNKNSQQISSLGAAKDFRVMLKPKRVHFTKDLPSPDGLDQTQAKLTFLTGSSGDWFSGNPHWSIIGDALGCTIDENTGWIRAGTEAGEITVQAIDSDLGATGHFLRGALKIGCQSCTSGTCGIGAGVCANLRNALSVDLGKLPCDGSFIGSIRLKLTSPSASLATPGGLTYDQISTDNALPEILNDTLGNYATPVRQVLAPQCLADIVTVSGTEYRINLYWPKDVGTKDANGYYQHTPGTAFKVWDVNGVTTDGSGNVTTLAITEDPDGVDSIINTFTWSATDGAWTLNRSSLRQERKVVVTGLPADPNAKREVAGSRRTETTKISTPGNSDVASKVTKTYATLSLNGGALQRPDVLVEERIEGNRANGAVANPDIVTSYYYAANSTPDGHEELERVVHSDGFWEHYVYDSSGRITFVYQPWLDSQPPADIDTTPSSVPNRKTAYDYTLLTGDAGTDLVTPRRVESYVDTTGGSPHLVARSYVLLTTDTTSYPQLDVRKDIQCPNSAAEWYDAGNPLTVTRTFSTGPNKGAIHSVDRPDGTRTLYNYYEVADGQSMDRVEEVSEGAASITDFTVTDGRKTITTTTAQSIVKSTVVKDIDSTRNLVDEEWSGDPDDKGRFPTLTHLDGTTETYIYDCCNVTQIIGRDGERTVFEPDALNRIWKTTVYYTSDSAPDAIPRIRTENTLDAAGNVTKTTRTGTDASGSTTIEVVPSRAYDRAGRVIEEENALQGTTRTVEETTAGGGRKVTITYPDNGQRIEQYYRDGRLAKVTGDAVEPVQYEYGWDPTSSQVYTKVTNLGPAPNYTPSAEWTKTYSDFQGRDYKTVFSDNAYSQEYFKNNGQLWKERDPDGVLTVYIYNSRGEVEYTEVGLKPDPATPPTAPDTTGEHRITRMERFVGNYDDGQSYDTLVTRVTEWTTANFDNQIVTSESHVALDSPRQWNVAYPNEPFKQVVKSVTQYGSGGSRTEMTTYPDNSYQIAAYSYGRPSSVTRYDSGGITMLSSTTYAYDNQGRLWTSTDGRNGTTTFLYNDADQITSTITPPPAQTTSALYDNMGRPTQVTEPDGGIIYTRYYKNGLVKLTWGARTYPSGYEYDAQGRITKLHTWRSFDAPSPTDPDPAFPSGYVTTTWTYDPYRGWLNNKRYSDTSGPDYTYTAGGRLKTRLWARLVPGTGTRLMTTYTYDFDPAGANANRQAGYLARIDYNDGSVPAGEISTPSITFDYDRRGRQRTVTQGGIMTTLAWHPSGALDSESYVGSFLSSLSVNIINEDPASHLLRRQSMEVEKSQTGITGTSVSYGYDTASRLQTVTSGGFSGTYGYAPKSSLIETTTFKQDPTMTRLKVTRQYDYLNRLQSIVSTPTAAAQPPLSHSYGYNAANQRTRRNEGDLTYWSYGYDAEGQLTSAKHYWYEGQPVPGQQFEFDYDDVGNRLTSSEGGDASGTGLRQSGYVPNDRNQYSSRSINAADRKVDVMGLALVQNGVPSTVTVQVNGGTPVAPDYRRGEYFWKALGGNGSGPNWLNVNVVDGSSSSSGNIYEPPQSESYTPDADGNLIADSRWVYKWDAENRLARMDTQASAAAAGVPAKRLQYTYDYQGRMIRRQVYSGNYNGGTITWNSTPDSAPGADLIFLYDGFECIAALKADQTLYQAYVWGVDVSGTLSGAGGVGGLLMFRTTSQTYFPTYDGSGNVMGLVNGSDGTVVARYEYGPFGNLQRVTGEPVATDNPFRFSSKWQDDQSDLLYYGLRWYSSYSGRWLSRDPIGENGGMNLFCMLGNSPLNSIDVFGLTDARWTLHWHHDAPVEIFEGRSGNMPYIATRGIKLAPGVNIHTRQRALLLRAGDHTYKAEVGTEWEGGIHVKGFNDAWKAWVDRLPKGTVITDPMLDKAIRQIYSNPDFAPYLIKGYRPSLPNYQAWKAQYEAAEAGARLKIKSSTAAKGAIRCAGAAVFIFQAGSTLSDLDRMVAAANNANPWVGFDTSGDLFSIGQNKANDWNLFGYHHYRVVGYFVVSMSGPHRGESFDIPKEIFDELRKQLKESGQTLNGPW